MAYIPPSYSEKKIHYFKKQHYNYYAYENTSNSDYVSMSLNGYIQNYDEDADGIHILNIKADVTLYDEQSEIYNFYQGIAYTHSRTLIVKLPEQVSGKVFVRVSFDICYYTEENVE